MKQNPQLILATSPILKHYQDTPFIMRQVVYSLLPVVIAATYFFGIAALLVLLASISGAIVCEYFFSSTNTITDASALITGILLGLTLPPAIPLWMAFLGGVIAIALGKLIFGGLGCNVFNPALVGRAFLQAAFPVAITTWSPLAKDFFYMPESLFAFPFTKAKFDAVTAATPLGKLKFESFATDYFHLFWGNTAGSLGETSVFVILICGLYLAIRGFLNWRIPAAIYISAFAVAYVLHQYNPKYPPALFQLLSGGMALGAFFMATDMVTSPVTPLGCWVFGAMIGGLVIVIRTFGGLPEGMMYAILLMNAFTPIINNFTQPRVYGRS